MLRRIRLFAKQVKRVQAIPVREIIPAVTPNGVNRHLSEVCHGVHTKWLRDIPIFQYSDFLKWLQILEVSSKTPSGATKRQ